MTEEITEATQTVQRKAREVGDSPFIEHGARAGYVANGLLHLLLGWVALQLALGRQGQSADQSGALGTLANNGLGAVLLGAIGVALVLLGLWQLIEAIGGHGAGRRLKALGKGIAYLAMGWTAFSFLIHQQKSSSSQTVDFTRTLMSKPGGVLLVAVVGLVVIGIGAYHVIKGARKKFLTDLVEHPGRVAEVAGMFGYIAKGIALAVVGVLFLVAARKHNASEARGLDGALRALLRMPAGPALLVVIALGFAAMGVYSFFRARHARV